MYRAMWVLVGAAWLGLLALNFSDYPPGNGRDELAHLRLIAFYHDAHRLPILPDDLARASEEAHQPPLYYVLMAGLLELGLPDPQVDAYQPNPFVLTGNYRPEIPQYNRALYVHTWVGCGFDLIPPPPLQFGEGENCGYIRTLHTMRAVCVLINVMGLAFVHLTIRIIFREGNDARPVSVLALALLTLTPSYWRTAMVINNNQLVFLFAAVTFWLLAKTLREGLRLRVSIGLGIALGLGMLSKVFFAPMIVAVILVLLRGLPHPPAGGATSHSEAERGFTGEAGIKHLMLILTITLLIAGWWYARNMSLYHDPTATTISERILNSRRETRMGLLEFFEVVTTWPGELWLESWTVLNTRLSLWLASGIGCGLMVSGLAAAMRRRLLIRGGGLLLISAFIPALMLAVVGAARNLHGHYSPPLMLTSLPATSILMAMGTLAWVPLRKRAAMTGVFAIIAGTVVFHATSFSPLFPPLEHGKSFAVENRVSVTFQNGARLVGYQMESRVLHPGDDTHARLCWEAEVPINQLYAVTTQLVLPDGSKAAQQDGYPLSGRYPTTAWQPSEIFCEWIPLHIRADALTPRAYDLRVGMYVFHGEDVPWLAGPDDWQKVLLLGKVLIVADEDFSHEGEAVARVDDWADLTRLDIHESENSIALDIGWRARGSSERPYRYFVHALDAEGNIIAQIDRDPLNGSLPTDFWRDGLTLSDHLRLELPPQTVCVIFGMYDPLTGRRGLWAVDGEARTEIELRAPRAESYKPLARGD